MQIYCSIFVPIVGKESQVFYNILYRYLKRMKLLFKTLASPFSPVWLIIGECAFSTGIYDNVRSLFWNSFTQKGFPGTNQAASVNEFSTINEQTIFFGLIRISCSWGRGLRVLGTMAGYCKLVQLKSGEEHIPVLFSGALLKSYWKGEMHKEDLCFTFVSLHLSPDCKDLNARLYIEVVGGIGRKQTDLLSENLAVEKTHEKLWDEEATLKSLFFFLILCLLLYSVLRAGFLLW